MRTTFRTLAIVLATGLLLLIGGRAPASAATVVTGAIKSGLDGSGLSSTAYPFVFMRLTQIGATPVSAGSTDCWWVVNGCADADGVYAFNGDLVAGNIYELVVDANGFQRVIWHFWYAGEAVVTLPDLYLPIKPIVVTIDYIGRIPDQGGRMQFGYRVTDNTPWPDAAKFSVSVVISAEGVTGSNTLFPARKQPKGRVNEKGRIATYSDAEMVPPDMPEGAYICIIVTATEQNRPFFPLDQTSDCVLKGSDAVTGGKG